MNGINNKSFFLIKCLTVGLTRYYHRRDLALTVCWAIWKIDVCLQWHNDALPVYMHQRNKTKTAKIVKDDLRYEYSSDHA